MKGFLLSYVKKSVLDLKLWGPLKNCKTRRGSYSGLGLSRNVKKGKKISLDCPFKQGSADSTSFLFYFPSLVLTYSNCLWANAQEGEQSQITAFHCTTALIWLCNCCVLIVCVVSTAKYEHDTPWPAFSNPIHSDSLKKVQSINYDHHLSDVATQSRLVDDTTHSFPILLFFHLEKW